MFRFRALRITVALMVGTVLAMGLIACSGDSEGSAEATPTVTAIPPSPLPTATSSPPTATPLPRTPATPSPRPRITRDNVFQLARTIELAPSLAGPFQPVNTAALVSNVQSVAFDPDGALLLTGTSEMMRLWEVETGEALASVESPAPSRRALFVADGRMILNGYVAGAFYPPFGTLGFWQVDGLQLVGQQTVRVAMLDIALSLDNRALAIGGRVYTATVTPGGQPGLLLWDLENDAPLADLSEYTPTPSTLAYSPDGALLASGSYDGDVRLWTLEALPEHILLEGPRTAVRALVFSPNGSVLASANGDGAVRLWEVATGEPLAAFETGSGANTVAFTPAGDLLFSSHEDGAVRVWDVAERAEVLILEASFPGQVFSMAVSPEGTRLATGGADSTAWLWLVME